MLILWGCEEGLVEDEDARGCFLELRGRVVKPTSFGWCSVCLVEMFAVSKIIVIEK